MDSGCTEGKKDTYRQTGPKGGLFSESAIRFSKHKKKYIFHKTILSLKFKIPTHKIVLLWAGILNFKFRLVFLDYFFGRFEKRIALSEKSHL